MTKVINADDISLQNSPSLCSRLTCLKTTQTKFVVKRYFFFYVNVATVQKFDY